MVLSLEEHMGLVYTCRLLWFWNLRPLYGVTFFVTLYSVLETKFDPK